MRDYQEMLSIYKQAINLCPDFERKGKTMPYTSANGYMFSQLNKAGEIGIRLPKEVATMFLTSYESGPFLSYGAVMREYVLVPEELLADPSLMASYLEKGYQYVMSLPPK